MILQPGLSSPRELLGLPFDQYQRYRLVSEVLDRVRPTGTPLRILDVGGRTAVLRSFSPDDDVTLVDLEVADSHGLVLGDGSRLPFATDSFHVVTGCDTLEHVPRDRRTAFVSECARVASHYVILAGPFRAPEVDEAEQLLEEFLHHKLDVHHRYLHEHRANGLPLRSETEAELERLGANVQVVGHGNLERWLALMCMSLYMDADPGLRPVATRFFRFYNEKLFRSDHRGPVYRHVVVAALNGSPQPSLDDLFEPPEESEGALACVRPMVHELLAFDHDKDVLRPEFERLGVVLHDVEKDLAGHKESLATVRDDLLEHQRTLSEERRLRKEEAEAHERIRATLTADLIGHRALVEALQAEVTREQSILVKMRAENEQTVAEVRQDLEGHRAVLDETRERAEQLMRDLEAHREHQRGLLEQLVLERAEAARLRAELWPRGKNLKRALKLRVAPQPSVD